MMIDDKFYVVLVTQNLHTSTLITFVSSNCNVLEIHVTSLVNGMYLISCDIFSTCICIDVVTVLALIFKYF